MPARSWRAFRRSPRDAPDPHPLDSAFDEMFRTKGFKIFDTPARTPVANTFAERCTRSLRRDFGAWSRFGSARIAAVSNLRRQDVERRAAERQPWAVYGDYRSMLEETRPEGIVGGTA